MYYSIKGQVEYFEEGRLIVNNNGIGYDICVSNYTLTNLSKIGETVTVYTYLAVSENGVRLFGFSSKEEKAMFEKLIQISGVGPKMAIQILSGVNVKDLALCIVNADIAALSKIKGIGKKTAGRIIVELKEKIEQEDLNGLDGEVGAIFNQANDSVASDAILALLSLGLSKSDAANKVAKVRPNANTVEEIITQVLRGMGN